MKHSDSLQSRRPWPLAVLSLSALLAACGGGGGGGGTPPAGDPPTGPAVLQGTAAIGAALEDGLVVVIDRTGNVVCTNEPVVTDATGAYRCELRAGSAAPFVALVTDTHGLVSPMVSISTTTPAPGTSATANITPLTTAIAAQMDPNKDPFALYNDPDPLPSLDIARLNALKAQVVAQLAPVLVSAGIVPAGFDPVATPFVGGSGTGADQVLDQVRVSFDNGTPHLYNALNPDVAAVPMADAGTANPPLVATSAAPAGFRISDLDIARTEFERCFAVPSATRTINPDMVNQRLDEVAVECRNIIAEAGDPQVDMDFLHNGQDPFTYFFGLLTSADMDGAVFNVPELMRFVPRPDGRDEALLNLKFRTQAGVTDNRILTAKLFPGSRPSGSQWWLVGNQRPVDAYVRTALRLREQTIPQAVLDASPAFNNTARSRFESGIEIFVQRPNNGGTVSRQNNPNNALRYVRVKGPGLPTAGLVFADAAAGMPQNWMGILNATGTVPSESGAAQQFSDTSSNIFRLQRTQGLTGSAAFTARPNPNVGAAGFTANDWAHPAMYGESPNANWLFDLGQVPAWSQYNFEAFCGNNPTPCHTFSTRITTPVMPAASAAALQWHQIAGLSRAFVADGAAATNSVELSWTPNNLAERVGSVNAYSYSPTGAVNSASIGVPRGVFGRTLTSVGGSFPAISVSDTTRGRTLQLRHATLDGSYKDMLVQFN